MPENAQRDVGFVPELFLSYSSADHEAVFRIQRTLEKKQISTFMDRKDLEAGMPWVQALEEALRRVRGVAIFLGPGGLGPWQRRELWWALDRQARAEAAGQLFPVIPVLLPETKLDSVPSFLMLNMWVDLRRGLEDEGALDALTRAVCGDASTSPAPPAVPAGLCPYRGLHAFREEDSPLFFGREDFARTLFQKVEVDRLKLVALVGPSGGGKSSVVQAGLLPMLRRTRPPQSSWDAVTFKPGRHPFRNLAAALVSLLEPHANPIEQLKKVGETASDLGAGLEAQGERRILLSEVIARALKENPGTDRLLLVVDQFEELFTLASEQVRQPFLEALLEAATASDATVLLTLRADYYGQVIESHRGLSDLLLNGHVPLGRMSTQELQHVITKPAERFGVRFEPGLVERILKDVEREPGSLPLLEFALTQLWQERKGGVISNEQYKDDTLKKSISNRATERLELLPPAQRELAMRGMTRLVRVVAASEEGADTRQRVGLRQFDEATRKALAHFAEARLLVMDRHAATGEETIEVAHEALIRTWTQLRKLLEQDREFLLWRQRLAPLLDTWQRAPRKDEALLPQFLLEEASGWLKSREQDLNEAERSFIRESLRRTKAARQARAWALRIGGGLAGLSLTAAASYGAWTYTEHYQLRELAHFSVDAIASDAENSSSVIPWAEALCRAGRISEAIEAARKLKDYDLRGEALFVVAGQLALAGDTVRAQELMTEGVPIIRELSRAQLTATKVLAEQIGRSGKPAGLDFMSEVLVKQSGWQQAAVHAARAQGLRSAGAALQAREAFDKALVSIQRARDESVWYFDGLRELIQVLVVEAQHLHQETALKQTLQEAEARSRTAILSSGRLLVPLNLAYGLALLGDSAAAALVLEKGLSGITSWDSSGLTELQELVELLARSGETAKMLSLVREPETALFNVDIAMGLLRAGQKEGALELPRELPSGSVSWAWLNEQLQVLIKVGELEEARQLLLKALPKLSSAGNAVAQMKDIAGLAESMFKLGEIESALSLANQAGAAGEVTRFNPGYGDELRLLGKAQLLGDMLAHVAEVDGPEKALSFVERIHSKLAQAAIRARLVTVLAKQGKALEAADLSNKVLEVLSKPEYSITNRNHILAGLVVGLVRAGAPDLALEVTRVPGYKADESAYVEIAVALAEQGRAEQAFGVLTEAKFASDAFYSRGRAGVIGALAAASQTEAALKQFPMDRWKEMHGDDRCSAATAIATAHAQAGKLRLARLAVSRFCPEDENMLKAYTTLLVEYLDRQKASGGEARQSPAAE